MQAVLLRQSCAYKEWLLQYPATAILCVVAESNAILSLYR